MATGTILLPNQVWTPDPTNPPGMAFALGAMTWLFDDTTPEALYTEFRMPQNYASAPVFKLQYSMVSATADDVEFEISVYAVTPGDSQDLDAESYDSVNSGTDTVPGTAGHMKEISTALSNADSVAAGDYVRIKLERDADDATNDDATGDCQLRTCALEYTTT